MINLSNLLLLEWIELCLSQSAYIDALTLNVTVLEDRATKEIIRLNEETRIRKRHQRAPSISLCIHRGKAMWEQKEIVAFYKLEGRALTEEHW